MIGPGGIGKTRLALAVADEVAPDFSNAVFFVPLAAITDPSAVPIAIAQVLGVQQIAERTLLEGLKNYLRGRKALLILDNFEHVSKAAPIVSELVAAAPELKLLITSRVALTVYGERHFPVPPLVYPHPGSEFSPELLVQCEAIRLFIDRALSIKPHYSFTDTRISTVAQICQRLDGLPLAIELAAARISLLSPVEILARLEQGLEFLRGGPTDKQPHQRTLKNTITWSYNLLEPFERMLFQRLAVFVGGYTLEAALSICSLDVIPEVDLIDGIQALLNKSLIREVITTDGEPRFGMLETIREFALEQLTAGGEEGILKERHAAYYLTLAEAAEPKLLGEESIPWLDQLEAEYGNLRAALAWLKLNTDRAETGLRLTGALCRFWELRGQFAEGRDWLTSLLAHSLRLPTAVRAKALDGAGILMRHQCDYDQARLLHEESLVLWRTLDHHLGMARSCLHLGIVAYSIGDLPEAKRHLDAALTMVAATEPVTEEAGDVVTQTLNGLGVVFRGHSKFDQAGVYFERALVLSRTLGNQRNEAQILGNLGAMKNSLRQYRAAREYLTQSLEIRRPLC